MASQPWPGNDIYFIGSINKIGVVQEERTGTLCKFLHHAMVYYLQNKKAKECRQVPVCFYQEANRLPMMYLVELCIIKNGLNQKNMSNEQAIEIAKIAIGDDSVINRLEEYLPVIGRNIIEFIEEGEVNKKNFLIASLVIAEELTVVKYQQIKNMYSKMELMTA